MNDRTTLSAVAFLRGFAVIAVVLYHYSWFVHPLESTILRKGYIGVDIFFIISGFLACHTTRKIKGSLSSLLKYILSRLIRIYPAYFIITIGYVITQKTLFSTYPDFSVLVKSLLFFPQSDSGSPVYGSPVVDVGWTLNYEFFFT
ncbi:acyltransferase [Rosenbergiella australiborealis]|uniref:Acyltransferase n=1 Tax=Rosenbergiella australiborealis TaxID=1544696 RepID=A0ABS5T6D5_9GAMM|nr:acyltransferase [Rosenbergiella australiborealis]MBT0727901.1 acyltransferase [Rosenbergiella australiborealis]